MQSDVIYERHRATRIKPLSKREYAAVESQSDQSGSRTSGAGVADISTRIGRLEVEMEVVQQGVSNFRNFQTDMRRFVTQFETNTENRAKLDAKRARIHYALITLLIGLVVAMFSFLLNHYDGHKISFGSAPPGLQSQQKPPQDAGNPPY